MLPSTALLLLSLPLALAQYGGGGAPPAPTTSTTPAAAPPATPTSSSSASLQTVTVGDNEAFAFSPNSLVAAVGSQVEFVFFPPTHSVVQASFDAPCQPSNSSAFFSGAFTTSSGPNANSFTITINDTNPIWFFCGFPAHCEAGMVGVINPPTDNSQTQAMFAAAAAKVGSTTDPTFGAQGGIVGPVKAAAAAGSSTTPSASAPSASAKSSATELTGSIAWASILVTLVAGWGFAELMS